MKFLLLFPFIIALIELLRIINLFKRNKDNKATRPETMMQYPIVGIIIATLSLFYILHNNYIFLNCINIYRVQAYPDCTLYCHVSLYNDITDAIYPCEVYKYSDEDDSYYQINSIYLPDEVIDLSLSDIQISPEKYEIERFADQYEQYYETKMKLINIKYKPTADISKSDEIWEYADLVLAVLNLIFIIDTLAMLLGAHKKLMNYNAYFQGRFGHLCNPMTGEAISGVQSYLDAIDAQDKMQQTTSN